MEGRLTLKVKDNYYVKGEEYCFGYMSYDTEPSTDGKDILKKVFNTLGKLEDEKDEKGMTPEQIREVVRITMDEIENRKTTTGYKNTLKQVEWQLERFFKGIKFEGYEEISRALKELAHDEYIDVIYYQYKERRSIAYIAEKMDKDETTILRNKKRLIYRIADKTTK